MITEQIRARFAPSPTGFLHIGGVRTALFNYLFAKAQKGKFILRVEDTDKERSEPKYEKDILESLKWFGLDWDEGPFRQSERLDIYEKYLKKLLAENKAYYCFCSEDELEAQRQDQMSRGEAPRYTGKCANLNSKEAEKKMKEGKPAVIRFRVEPKKVKFPDLIRGEVEFDAALLGDVVIAKDLRSPLYNFSVVIDDYEMKISHVIRGEEHLSNTPRQVLLHEALNFPLPKYAHIPLILAPDRSKLSKRHGAVSATEYKKEGYLPEAIINFIAFLGWNPGRKGEEDKSSSSRFADAREKEIYSLEELAKDFSLEKVQKAGAIFNIQRLDYLNGYYIRQKSTNELAELCQPYLPEENGDLEKIVALYQERLKKLSEITELTDYFFKDGLEYDRGLLMWKEMTDEEIKNSLEKLEKILAGVEEKKWTKENLENILMLEAEKEKDRGRLLWPLRAALTGKKASAGPFDVAAVLGKEKTLQRIKEALKLLI